MIFCITIEDVLEMYEEVIHSSIIEELQRQIQNVLSPNGSDAFYALLESDASRDDVSRQVIDDSLPYIFLYNNFGKTKNQKVPKQIMDPVDIYGPPAFVNS